MAKKLFASLASAALMTAMVTATDSQPAAATTYYTVVSGHDLKASGLLEFRDQCDDVNPNPPGAGALSRRGGTVGSHSIGWQYSVGNFEVGALAGVGHPTTLNTAVVDVYSPTVNASGHAVGLYLSNTSPWAAGVWVGFGEVTSNAGGWHPVNANIPMYWEYYEGGQYAGYYYPNPMTVAEVAVDQGGDGRGAAIGVAMGCGQEAFYVDNLRVADAFDQDTYDFEGVTSSSGLGWLGLNKKGKKDVFFSDVSVWYGQPLKLLGLGWDAAAQQVYPGGGGFYAKRRGDGSFKRVHGEGFDPAHFAQFKTKPKEQTTYVFASDGTDWYDETNGSNAINVHVLARMHARINDLSLKPGQRAVLSGRIAPGDRGTKVTLQRRSGHGWSTADSTRTGGGGSFSVSTTATRVGKLVLRLKVASPRRGIGGAVSTWVTVDVTPRPKPKPPHPGNSTVETETPTTVSTSTPPTPDDENIRIMARLAAQPLPTPAAQPDCNRPAPFIVCIPDHFE